MPSFSTSPRGKTRDAKARRKILLNSESRPPIPISSNLKFGANIAFGAALKQSSYLACSLSSLGNIIAHFLEDPLSFISESPALIKFTSDLSNRIPTPSIGAPPFISMPPRPLTTALRF